jgi:MFS family permease
VCDDAYKADLATTIYFCGVTLGGILFGVPADKFGRKPIIAVTLLATGIIGMAIFIFRTYVAFVVLRFCLGLVIQVYCMYSNIYLHHDHCDDHAIMMSSSSLPTSTMIQSQFIISVIIMTTTITNITTLPTRSLIITTIITDYHHYYHN